MHASSIQITTLGSFCVSFYGRSVDVGRNKNKALLAFLALNNNRVFTRDFLADLLWSDTDAQRARHSLKQSVYELKRVLPSALDISPTTLGCNSSCVETDVSQVFQNLTSGFADKAVSLIRGELLQDVITVCGENFEQWCSEFNHNLFAQIDRRIEALLPSLSTTEVASLGSRLLAGIALPITSAAILPRASQANDSEQSQSRLGLSAAVLPFVGRQRHIDELMTAWEKCQSGAPQFVAVVGKAGFGKTRLATEFLERIRVCDPIILRENCYRSERRIGFSAATDLITTALGHADPGQIEPIWLDALAELLPGISPNRSAAPALNPVAAQVRLFEAIRHVLEHLASNRATVIVLEDGQWCDRSSQALLAHISHRIRDVPLFVLVTSREFARTDEALPWFEWRKVHVHEFSESDVEHAIEALNPGVECPTARQLHSASGGSPYFLTEVIRFSNEGSSSRDGRIPAGVIRSASSFVRTMILDLPRASRQCLEALAVIGRPVSLSALRRIASVPDADMALQHLIASGFVTRLQQRKVSLRHDLLRETVYRRTPVLRRTELHRRVARLCSRIDQRAGETAHHYYHAGERRNAYKFALVGSVQADARYANDESIALLKLAVRSFPKSASDIRPKLIERLQRAHRFKEAREEIRKYCANSNAAAPDEILKLRLLDLDLAKELGLIDGPALRAQITVLQKEPQDADKKFELSALVTKARSAFHEGHKDALVECIDGLRNFAVDAAGEQRCEAMVTAARLHALIHSVHQANHWLDDLRPSFDLITDHEKRLRMLAIVAAVKYQAGDLDSAETLQRDILSQTERIGAMILWPLVAVHQHMVLVEKGRYGEANTLSSEIDIRAKDLGATNTLVVLNANIAAMQVDMGEYANAQQSAETALFHLERSASAWIRSGIIGEVGICMLEQGKLADAFQYADQGEEMLAQIQIRGWDFSHLEILVARARTLRGRRPEAISRLRIALTEYADREALCHLKIQCELARVLKATDRNEARRHAKEVYEKASAIGARPLAERADSVLHRL